MALLTLALVAGAVEAQFAETKVFHIVSVSQRGLPGAPVVRDRKAGCLEGTPGVVARYGDRCVAYEADAVETCAKLANCAAVACLPRSTFSGTSPDPVGLDRDGSQVGASTSTRRLWAAADGGDPAGVRRELDLGADVRAPARISPKFPEDASASAD